jgi:hypothetical protein
MHFGCIAAWCCGTFFIDVRNMPLPRRRICAPIDGR